MDETIPQVGSWRTLPIGGKDAATYIQGLDQLLARMDAMLLHMRKIAIARSLRAGAVPIVEDAKRRAPDDIDTSGSRIRDNVKAQIVNQSAYGATAQITVRPWNFIARFAETGTAHQSAKPWLRPAFDANIDKAYEIIGQRLAEEIEAALTRK